MSEKIRMVKLTPAVMTRFHRLLPIVMRDRGWSQFTDNFWQSLHLCVAGAMPIYGIGWLDWSAANWLVFLVAGCWVGILCDAVRLYFLSKEIDLYCERVVEDTFVSVVSEAMRAGKKEMPEAHIASKPPYGMGLVFDLVFCTVSTLVILVEMPVPAGQEIFGQKWFVESMCLSFAIRIGMTLWEIVDHRLNPQKKPVVRLAIGLRAGGIFVVMFIVLLVEENLNNVVYVINGLVVLVGLMTLAGGFLKVGENRWLRKYVKEKNINLTVNEEGLAESAGSGFEYFDQPAKKSDKKKQRKKKRRKKNHK